MASVFVNYRVQDQPGYATLVHQALAQHLGSGQVFLAARSIRLGDDFVDRVFDTLGRCRVLIAVIGRQWGELLGEPGTDWVQREIGVAFSLGMRVIPVLVEDAEVPAEAELPGGIKALARCQHLRLRHYTIEDDLAHLVRELRNLLPHLADDARASGAAEVYRVGGSRCEFGIVPGDILRCTSADVWVNSENTDMRMARTTDFSVSGIIRFWGARRDQGGQVVDDVVAVELKGQVERRPVAPGSVFVTGSGELARSHGVRHVVHVAAVHGEPGAGYRQVGDVGACVRNVLAAVEGMAEARSVLFPLLGTGAAGADVMRTVEAMIPAAVDHVVDHPESRLRRIFFLGYTRREQEALAVVFQRLALVPVSGQ
ncbi:O-acetyl-ADP-ribose deacetylase (regulator of RNase III), contains Macro domain [Lentzea fradiae]|uniref:O-acetyl-ADP-ribose deacetylase (Regulator of RNase III), contains Macro domain n=1 Tax=Lentzea fradiae TaxID=200378 RepID=A0A1G7R7J1_9PSEU|nr:TIR domain-containing protein [Lentzea fradiae]SDG06674.1 O-acetyl-ADP-ribose deacetylase (regulator of RNase III), contains Macro domain [Lentzea fradiae]